MSDPTRLPVGFRLGQYEIIEFIAEGGMGAVYRGRDTLLDRDVAIKTLGVQLAQSHEFVERFRREARAMASVRSVHVVEIYAVDVENNPPYMVMAYHGAGSLARVLRRREGAPVPEPEALGIARQVAQALVATHSRRILHRDVKPSNVMQTDDGTYALTDFGIARNETLTTMTHSLVTIGTAGYMSPEQARAQPLDTRCDLYSLGVMLFEMLAGTLPFTAPDTLALMLKHITEPVPDLQKINSRVSKGAKNLVERLLAKLPDDRPQTAQEVIQTIDVILGKRPELTVDRRRKVVSPLFVGFVSSAVVVSLGLGVIAFGGFQPSAAIADGQNAATPMAIALADVASVAQSIRSSTPSLTWTPLPPTATQTPTSTSTVEQTKTSTATPTASQTPTTPSPVVNLQKPTPVPPPAKPPQAKYVAPRPISPATASYYGGGDIPTLAWSSSGELQPGDIYRISISHTKGEDVLCTRQTSVVPRSYLPSLGGAGYMFNWSVAVVRLASTVADGEFCTGEAVSGASATSSFAWEPSSSQKKGGHWNYCPMPPCPPGYFCAQVCPAPVWVP